MFRLEYLLARILSLTGPPPAQLAWARRLAARGAHQPALRLLVRAAKAGLPAAAHDLGCAYMYGRGVPPCLTEASAWLNQAAEAGEPSAQSLLARLALQGITLAAAKGLFASAAPAQPAPDYPAALHWAQRATSGGSADGQALLAFIRTAGPEEMRDQPEGERLYHVAAEAENAQGELGWAMALLRRNSREAAKQAQVLLQSAADARLPAAHYLLGTIAESGMADDPDFVAAAEHYRDAAELGHAAGQFRFGMALLTGRGIEQDRFEAESWLRRAAEAGHPGSARALARLILRGAGVPADPEEGVHWLRQAIAHGDGEARADLAGLALARRVPEADREATLHWFREGAEAGDPGAVCNLGICLAEGIGAPRDDAAALAMFRRAADSVPLAQYWCGRMLAEGRGATRDPAAARACFLRAADRQNADAEVAAGEMLINGRGGPADHPRAMALFERAAAVGHPAALYALKVLQRHALSSVAAT